MNSKNAIYDSFNSRELSVNKLIELYRSMGVSRVIYKKLSPNDNSKNQPYMGGNLTDLGFFPTGEIVASPSTSGKIKDPKRKIKYTASLNYYWLSSEGRAYKAPNAKLIYYPQYPEVRFSGFLVRCEFDMAGWMDPTRKGREIGRVLFFGIKNTGEIFAYLATPDSRIAKEINDYKSTEITGVFRELLIPRKPPPLFSERVKNKYRQTDLFEGLDVGNLLSQQKVADTSSIYSHGLGNGQEMTSSKGILINELKRTFSKAKHPKLF